jgi:stage II sporulation protein R
VLYPNMCFRGSVYEVVEDEAKENLKEVLTPDEYESIFDSGKYEIKLKILDIFR